MLKKISTRQLQIGMFLHGVEGSWLDHGLWRSRFLVNDEEKLAAVVKSGASECWIDTSKGSDQQRAPTSTAIDSAADKAPVAPLPSKAIAPPRDISVESELDRARLICQKARDAVERTFGDVRSGRLPNLEAVAPVVHEVVSSVTRNASALIGLVRLKTSDDYTYMHSVAVCTLMVALARTMGMDDAQCHAAGLAGLLHDIGKACVPQEALQKPGKLTDQEFEAVKQHPRLGYQLLVDAGLQQEAALDVCLHHHEKIDGSGYPDALGGSEISLMSRMGAICDVYDAVTSERPYKDPWDPAEAIARMASWIGHFDKVVFAAFIKTVGPYPPGSLVRLASGRLGVVMQHHPSAMQSPIVKVFFSTKSQMGIPAQVIDLVRQTNDRIVAREPREKWSFSKVDRYCVVAG